MDVPILELISSILDKGKFSKTKQSDAKLRVNIEKLFKIHKTERSELTARMVYSGIADLARFGKGELANEYAMKFEEEIGYEDFE